MHGFLRENPTVEQLRIAYPVAALLLEASYRMFTPLAYEEINVVMHGLVTEAFSVEVADDELPELFEATANCLTAHLTTVRLATTYSVEQQPTVLRSPLMAKYHER